MFHVVPGEAHLDSTGNCSDSKQGGLDCDQVGEVILGFLNRVGKHAVHAAFVVIGLKLLSFDFGDVGSHNANHDEHGHKGGQ